MAYKKFIQKIPAARKLPSPPPITFLMVRPLCATALKHGIRKRKQKRNTESNINDRK